MSNNNRNRSTPSTSRGAGGREADRHRHHRRNTDHAQTDSSSARSQRGDSRSASSSVSLNGTGGQAPDTDHGQTPLPQGWFMWDGHMYYPTPEGRYYRWDNVDSVAQDAGEYHGVPVDNNWVPTHDPAYRSGDEWSQRVNEGSAYFGSTPSGTEADTRGPLEEPQPIQDPFLHRDGPWSHFNMLSHVGGAASRGNTDQDGAYMGQGQAAGSSTIYPAMSEFGEDDNEDPTSSDPQA